MARNSMFGMAGIGIAAAIGFVFALTSLSTALPSPTDTFGPELFDNKTNDVPTTFALASTQALKKFASIEELKRFLSTV